MHDILRELRLAARQIVRRPMVGILAVTSLALGIGFVTTVFTLVDGLLHGGPPLRDPEHLVDVYLSDRGGFPYANFSWLDVQDLRAEISTLEEIAAYQFQMAVWDDGTRTRMLLGEEVTASYFDVLGVQPALGRGFRPEEDVPGEGTVVVLGHRFWTQELGADPDVLGSTIELSGVDFTIVGVAPRELNASLPLVSAEYWIPLGMHDVLAEAPRLQNRGARSLFVRARMQPDVETSQVQAELDTLAAQLGAAHPELFGERQISLVPTRDVVLNPGIDAPVTAVAALVMVLVGMVLVIACSNIAGILLARAADRRKEFAVRLAIGAGRWRLVRQLLSESLLLAIFGAIGGIGVAAAALRVLAGFQPDLPIPTSFDWGTIDQRVLLFTAAVALGTGVLCGLAPALQASNPRLVPALKDAGSGGAKVHRRFGLRNLLVVAQVAVSTVLLLGAGLFVRSLASASSIDPGYGLRQGAAVTFALGLGGRHTPEEAKVLIERIEDEVRALPGVRSAALIDLLPLSLMFESRGVEFEGQELPEDGRMPEYMCAAVGDGYFDTMEIDVVRGREFDAADSTDGPRVVIVNQTLAARAWPGEDPIGRRLRFGTGDEAPWYEVVGVAADGKYATLGEDPRPFVYRHIQQTDPMVVSIVAASQNAAEGAAARAEEARLLAAIRGVVEGIDREVPITGVRRMSEHLALILFPARVGAAVLAAFGLFGLVLAAAGLYGVVAYAVSRRTREVGIRVALGAGRSQILSLVMREGLALVAVGLVLGLAVAALGAQVVGSLLYGIQAVDPVTFLAVPALLVAVAAAANLLPARRALRIQPTEALRYE